MAMEATSPMKPNTANTIFRIPNTVTATGRCIRCGPFALFRVRASPKTGRSRAGNQPLKIVSTANPTPPWRAHDAVKRSWRPPTGRNHPRNACFTRPCRFLWWLAPCMSSPAGTRTLLSFFGDPDRGVRYDGRGSRLLSMQ